MAPDAYPRHLEARYLRAIQSEWHRVNLQQLRGALRPPAFELVDSEARLGGWHLPTRTISLGRSLVHRQPWGVVVEVLRHEIAHQFAHEVLGAVDESAHGEAFRQTCKRFGIDDAATGMPATTGPENRLHRRVEKLLALASSDNRNEAEAAAAEARRMMLVHNLSTPPSGYTFRHVGTPTSRVPQYWRQLASLLGKHFFVEVIWVPVFIVSRDGYGTVLELCGTPGNVEMAAWVHDWLLITAKRLWDESGSGGAAARARFFAGVMRGFHERLEAGQKKTTAEGLVWVGDPEVRRFLGRRHAATRTINYAVRTGNEEFNAGREKGRELVLNRPVTEGPGGPTRLIGKGP